MVEVRYGNLWKAVKKNLGMGELSRVESGSTFLLVHQESCVGHRQLSSRRGQADQLEATNTSGMKNSVSKVASWLVSRIGMKLDRM